MNNDIDRLERLIALLLIQNMAGKPDREKVKQLNLAGFSNVEIANILDTTAATVAQQLYESRKTSKKKREKKSLRRTA